MLSNKSKRHETLVSWYLRLNGYFIVDNFIVHAGDNPSSISDGSVAPHTEVDTLAMRMRYSAEKYIANHNLLVENQKSKYDFIIAEVKSGKSRNSNKPNNVWKNREKPVIEYIVKFSGLFEKDELISHVVEKLASEYCYEDDEVRIRYIMFANEENAHYAKRGISYITYPQIINFLVDVRGQSWIREEKGVASIHDQWDELINQIFCVANDTSMQLEKKVQVITRMLNC